MDNVTHSLAGLLLAEAAARLDERRTGVSWSAPFRTMMASASLIAANLPDADLVYAGTGGGLGYLLHHRGHTHTVVAVIAGTAIMGAIVALLWRWRAREALSRDEGRWLFGLLFASMLGHLVLDWTNSYGVHPFWPIDSRWRYGDSVFIVEPWLWAVSVPALVLASRLWVARALLTAVLLGGLVLAARVSLVSRGAYVALLCGAALATLVVLALRRAPRSRAGLAVAGWIAVTIVFAACARIARASVTSAVREVAPGTELLDVVVSPLPANAVCMSVITVERTGATYRVVTAAASALPALTPAARCPDNGRAGDMPATASRRSNPAVQWGGEWSAPVAELATLARESCPALAALRFIRAPVWRAVNDSTAVIGDARYGGTSAGGFTAVRVPRRSTVCPRGMPSWVPPRADLLGFRGP